MGQLARSLRVRVRVRDARVGVLLAPPFERARRRRRQRARPPRRVVHIVRVHVVVEDLADDLAYLIAYLLAEEAPKSASPALARAAPELGELGELCCPLPARGAAAFAWGCWIGVQGII